MRHVLAAVLRPMARLSVAAALALVALAAMQPMLGDGNDLLAAEKTPVDSVLSSPQQAEPDEGGTGVNNFDREEWYEFSILLAPFLVLVTFLLILMFNWDRSTNNED